MEVARHFRSHGTRRAVYQLALVVDRIPPAIIDPLVSPLPFVVKPVESACIRVWIVNGGEAVLSIPVSTPVARLIL